MTGFKTGASGDDPFGSNDGTGESKSEDGEVGTPSAPIKMGSQSASDENRDTSTDEPNEDTPAKSGLPWIYQRDSITDGRTKTVQLHLQDSTLSRQREARTDIGTKLGESVKKADLREAALLVGFDHLDEVADRLRDWGYDFE